jgi:hypothetical protein
MTRAKLPAPLNSGELIIVGGGRDALRAAFYGCTHEAADEPLTVPRRLTKLLPALVALKKRNKKR